MVKIGLIGAGDFGAQIAHCLSTMRNVRLAAVADAALDRAKAVAARFNVPAAYSDAGKLLREEIDAVVIATPETAHVPAALAAIESGKHVFIEKPMAHTAAAAREIAASAKARGVMLMPGHVVRFEERCRAAKLRLAEAGPVRAIRCFQHRPRSAFATYSRAHTALVVMLHQIDLCRWFAGSEAEKVDAREICLHGGHCPSIVWAMLQFENGAVATLQSGYTLECDGMGSTEDGIEIVTDRERIRIAFSEEGYEIRGAGGLVRPDLSYGPALRRELAYWIDCIETNTPPEIVTAADGIAAVEIAERIIASGRANRVEPADARA